MDMAVNKPGGDIAAVKVDLFLAFVIADPRDMLLMDRNVRRIDLARKNIDQLAVLEHDIRFFFSAGNGNTLFQSVHIRKVYQIML